ncbi:MAG: class B sortase [Eubacteriales bacterium]|nr:class B sortase [Eubacteriales bacterium]
MANKKYHRGRRKGRGYGKKNPQRRAGVMSTIVFVIALAVFAFSAFQLFRIFSGYHKGQEVYDEVRDLAVQTSDDDESPYWVDFEELLKINPDTVGWIRFSPEPSQIDYPLVQTTDNDLYLSKTFSSTDNTVGAIFVNCYNSPDFSDRNTIIYGHRMKDHSMFHDLEKYSEKSFWEDNQYFYIYTPDGREITYHIFSAGIVKDTSDTYLTDFADDASYEQFLKTIEVESAYDTGVAVEVTDSVVTLSTCTAASDDNRMVVRGVKESERPMEKPE